MNKTQSNLQGGNNVMKRMVPFLLVCLLLVTSIGTAGAQEEPYTVRLLMFGDATTEACQEVSAALSAITLPAINANVELVRVGFGSYADQLNLMLSSGEKLDAFCTLGTDITALANNGQILPMGDLLAEYGKDIRNGISDEDFRCSSVNGQIYGFRTTKETATSYGYVLLKSVADAVGVTPDPDTYYTLDQLQEILVKVKAMFPDQYSVGTDYTNMYMPNTCDDLSGGLGVLEDALNPSTTVVNWFKSDSYVNFVTKMYEWAQLGFIMPDAANNSESRLSLMQAGVVIGGFMGFNPNNVENFSKELGQELVKFNVSHVFSVTGHVSGILWCIAGSSANPEKTMEVLNMAYTDPAIANLLVNGIEGKNYVVTDAANGYADYPEGVDASTTTYSRLNWSWPNAAIAYKWNGERADLWEYMSWYNDNAFQSPGKGFRFKTDAVENELTACSNVVAKYDLALQCGELDPAVTLPKFYEELDSAGIAAVIAEKQAQLDAWLAQK
jgi:putative aldouronate transport system substrate-binding protein